MSWSGFESSDLFFVFFFSKGAKKIKIKKMGGCIKLKLLLALMFCHFHLFNGQVKNSNKLDYKSIQHLNKKIL